MFVPGKQAIIDDAKDSGDFVLTEQIGVPDGVAGLDEDGNIVATPIHRFGTAATINAIVLKDGEIAFATDSLEWRRGDGATLGGLFFASQPVQYVGGPTELTSTSADSITITHSTVASAIYRIWGDVSFSGDTDNQSNFRFALSATGGLSANYPTISSLHATLQWISSTLSGMVTPDIRFFTPSGLVGLPTMVATPINTSNPTGSLRLDALLATNTAGTLTMAMRLRTAKTGSPTVLAAHRIFVQRIQ
ncbi:hypothetical protein E6Q11_00930 [Candidatus Dojkabacteria bacterium]|uniref:Uncharacterized protein n=1 Tax=Candidatus Dojkabacteria bacterium TaxID=2099670 RepID=A0A5C7JA64_9BACT|nr:MAG: hypothetical protein E6Q11_00930 [Candidatus Dojkabacteria bacterium]